MANHTLTILIFAGTYVGIALGGLPGLALDRTGVAILGAILMLATGALSFHDAVAAIDFPTIMLLYALMIVSAQFRLAGAYTKVVLLMEPLTRRPKALLAAIIGTSAVLSALLANDIVCLAFTPVLCVLLRRAGLNPNPYLLALACSSNVGSAATIIGNPQNMLIGQVGNLAFGKFLLHCGVPAALGLGVVHGGISLLYRGRFHQPADPTASAEWPPFNQWQTAKGVLLTTLLIVLFLTPLPREICALAVAGVILCSRRMASPTMLALVDWHLISLFCALFVVVHAAGATGLPRETVDWLASHGVALNDIRALFPLSVILSNIFSNVPAVMLLIPHLPAAGGPAWYALALGSTLAGNFILIGSIANLIVAEQAARCGVTLTFREHARTGIPITLATLGIAWIWIAATA